MPLKKRFDYIIIDEAHKVKNKDSNRRKNIQKVTGTTPHIQLLTGTPLLNRLEVIYQIDHRLDPGIFFYLIVLYASTVLLRICFLCFQWSLLYFPPIKELYQVVDLASRKRLGKWKDFNTRFVRPIVAARQRTASEYDSVKGARALKDLKAVIEPVCLVRKRNDHLSDIVPKNDELDCWCVLSEKQRDLYKSFLAYLDNLKIAGESMGCVFPLIMKLRMVRKLQNN
jgi:SNF2 family DNA or RNA helicase